MITDKDLVPFDFSDDEDVETEAPSSRGIVPQYVDRQIGLIPVHGDDSRWRLASHLDMFENLNPNGSLTPEQRQAVDNFAIGWKSDLSEANEYIYEGDINA